MEAKGTVYLVGAGPGDAGLLTLRGAELLSEADVIVYDGLVNTELLRHAGPKAEIIYGGKHDRSRSTSQETLNALLIAKANEGKRVVRLKGGDPYVFARGGEEASHLAAAGIPFEVIPGVSSAEAVPNYAGFPLTHRDYCSSYTVVTGHECAEPKENRVDWARMAQVPGTLVILMGLKHMADITQALIRYGRAPETPAAMVRWGTTSRQQTIVGTLATIAAQAAEAGLLPPVVTIIGEVVALRKQLNWFERRPLLGQRIVVTRPREQAEPLVRLLRNRGAEVLEVPTIRIGPPERKEPIIDVLAGIGQYDWIVFTSPNGVSAFFGYFFQGFPDLRDLGGVRLAAVGPGTAAKLRELHLHVDVMPDEYLAPKIAKAMAAYESIENLKILLLRAEVANPELPKVLEAMGAIVDDVACYQTLPESADPTTAAAQLAETGADWITFTSGSTVAHFHARFPLPELVQKFPEIRLASIGPETTKIVEALGLKVAVEAKAHTVPGLVSALEKAARANHRKTPGSILARPQAAVDSSG